MAIIPRRHRITILKVLVLIPLVWIISVAVSRRSKQMKREGVEDELIEDVTNEENTDTRVTDPGFVIVKDSEKNTDEPSETPEKKVENR